MTVADLIIFLQQQPQGLPVAYAKFSEQCLLAPEDITIGELCYPRDDGWVESRRPDKKTQKYLIFPGY